MFKFFGFFISCLCALSNSNYAQEPYWVPYITKIEGRPASILVDMDLSRDRQADLPYLVITGPVEKNCPSTGIPDSGQIHRMEDVLETTSITLTGITTYQLTGTITSNCARLNCYYVKDTTRIRSALRHMYDRSFKSYPYIALCSYDPRWSYYTSVLYPDVEMAEGMLVTKHFTQKLKPTDTIGKMTHLDIAACFNADSTQIAFDAWAVNEGFTVDKKPRRNTKEGAYCTVITCDVPLRIDTVAKKTLAVKYKLYDIGGIWSGWQTRSY